MEEKGKESGVRKSKENGEKGKDKEEEKAT